MQHELAWMDGEWPLRVATKDQAVSNQGNPSVGTNAGMVFEQLMGENKGDCPSRLNRLLPPVDRHAARELWLGCDPPVRLVG